MKVNNIYKKLSAVNSGLTLKDLLKLRKTVENQIKEDKKKNTKKALKSVENNKEWLTVYDIIINFSCYSLNVERINNLVKLHNKRI